MFLDKLKLNNVLYIFMLGVRIEDEHPFRIDFYAITMFVVIFVQILVSVSIFVLNI